MKIGNWKIENYGARSGITIIEIVIALAILVMVAVLGLVALNPAGQLGNARNNQRIANVNTILLSIRTNLSDSRTGVFNSGNGSGVCAAGDLPTSSKKMAVGAGNYDIAGCLAPTYLAVLPFDPSAPGAHYASVSDYDTGYYLIKNASSGLVTISAPSAEFGKVISATQ